MVGFLLTVNVDGEDRLLLRADSQSTIANKHIVRLIPLQLTGRFISTAIGYPMALPPITSGPPAYIERLTVEIVAKKQSPIAALPYRDQARVLGSKR
jgi:hypothetical protein